jgi:hypothetical protein
MQAIIPGYIKTNLFRYNLYIKTTDLKLIGAEPKLQISCYGICNKFVISKLQVL